MADPAPKFRISRGDADRPEGGFFSEFEGLRIPEGTRKLSLQELDRVCHVGERIVIMMKVGGREILAQTLPLDRKQLPDVSVAVRFVDGVLSFIPRGSAVHMLARTTTASEKETWKKSSENFQEDIISLENHSLPAGNDDTNFRAGLLELVRESDDTALGYELLEEIYPGDRTVSQEKHGGESGLLDLDRDADDTGLGAELLDEIYPGEDSAAPPKSVSDQTSERRNSRLPGQAEAEKNPVTRSWTQWLFG